jgi:hypothetical protein
MGMIKAPCLNVLNQVLEELPLTKQQMLQSAASNLPKLAEYMIQNENEALKLLSENASSVTAVTYQRDTQDTYQV